MRSLFEFILILIGAAIVLIGILVAVGCKSSDRPTSPHWRPPGSFMMAPVEKGNL